MRTLPKGIIEAAAKKSSQHFEFCDRGETWEDCPACRAAFDRAHYAVHGALGLIVEYVAGEIERVVASGEHPRPKVERGEFLNDAAWSAEIVRKAFTEEATDA
ncbi:hypothetical protein [Acrocarpospora sp. B8E8]|uniref:hypothetical protein n=1 Tax=Acrocarpospora sp. B8E8 TaxID=3153572 RepID=UPI00325E9171